MNHAILLSALLVASGAAQADGPLPPSNDTRVSQQSVYTYAIELDRDGSVSRLSPHGFNADAISRKLDAQIGAWIFEAAETEGRRVPTATYLRVVVARHADDTGGFAVVSALTGPAPERLTQPDYPVRDQRAGMQGTVVLKLQVGSDGRVAAVDVHEVAGNVSRSMAQAAKSSALEWRFTPEMADGKPLASTILWPVCFLGAQSSASGCRWYGPDSQRFSSKTVLTLNPAARLISPLAFEGR